MTPPMKANTRQHPQRPRHDGGRFMRVFGGSDFRLAEKRDVEEPEHVERRQTRDPGRRRTGDNCAGPGPGRGLNPLNRNPLNGGTPLNASVPTRNVQNVTGIFFSRPPIFQMSCSSCSAWMTEPAARNSSALKNAWVVRWNIAASGRQADGHDHVAELRERRVGEDALDVVLLDGDERREQRGEAADVGDDVQRVGVEQKQHPAKHVNAGGHHRRGVDQGGDGRRAFHRVRQPDMQRELRRLADRAAENQQAGDGRASCRARPDLQ